MKFRFLLSATAFALAITHSQAAIISATGATTNMGSGFGTLLSNTINGVGLSSLSLAATHAATLPGNSWVSSGGILTGNITFALGGLHTLDGFSFWNQNNEVAPVFRPELMEIKLWRRSVR